MTLKGHRAGQSFSKPAAGAVRTGTRPASYDGTLCEASQAETPEFLTDAQLAARWQLSRGTLANQRSQGRGPSYLKIAGRVRYRRSDVEAFEQVWSIFGAQHSTV